MSATTSAVLSGNNDASNSVSDAEIEEVLDSETEVGISVVDQNRTRAAILKFVII